MPDTRRAERAAAWYMAHKGYKDACPKSVEEVEDVACWYFVYELPDGELELEVEFRGGDWHYFVTGFFERRDRTPVAAGR